MYSLERAHRVNRRRRHLLAAVAAPVLISVGDLFAQDRPTHGHASTTPDSVVVVAGPRYSAGSLQRVVLGSGYRDLWTTPITVPLLRPDTFAGGLTMLQRGASPQTLSLRFADPDGFQYVFRSVDKEQAEGLPPDIQRTIIGFIAQDLVSAKHPGGAMVIAPLQRAAGILHATPRLSVMADHPILGEHREVFAGMLGMMEERPDEIDDQPGFFGFERIIGTERLLERLEESPEDRVDSRAYLRARLMDVLVGDWDRHADQWRWAEEERNGTRYWLAIPRDRDNAFSHVDGWVGRIASMLRPTVLRYEAHYVNPYGLIHNAQALDRRILADLPAAAWDSVAFDMVASLSDPVIDGAVNHLPDAWIPLEAAPLAHKLKARRDALPAFARLLYSMMNADVDVYATDASDFADVERRSDGTVRVRLASADRPDEPYFERLFIPGETRDVRIHLRGGSDRAIVRGQGGGMNIRILGGGGDDLLEDYSVATGGAVTAFYDDRGGNTLTRGARTVIDYRTYEPPVTGFAMEGNAPPARDWGDHRIPFLPAAGWVTDIGPIIGGGPVWTRYGFRRIPYASRIAVTGLVSPSTNRWGVEATGRFIRTGGGSMTRLSARANQFGVSSFSGFGNETRAPADRLLKRVHANEIDLTADLDVEVRRRGVVTLGAQVNMLQPEPRFGSPAVGVAGSESFGVAGVSITGALDTRDDALNPRSGVRLEAGASTYPLVWGDAPEPFTRASVTGSTYLPLPGPLAPVVALRSGAVQVWGNAPFQYAAFLGGSNLRGYSSNRFAGDAAVFGNAELRTTIGRANMGLLSGDLGTIARADIGRVFLDGEDSNRWHTALGGGLWFSTLEGSLVLHLLYAHGERDTVNLGFGLPF